MELSFAKNGAWLGPAFRVPKGALEGRALLPHFLCRGCAVELNFGRREPPFYPPPEGFLFLHALPPELRVRTPLPPKSSQECEVRDGSRPREGTRTHGEGIEPPRGGLPTSSSPRPSSEEPKRPPRGTQPPKSPEMPKVAPPTPEAAAAPAPLAPDSPQVG